MRLGSSTSSAFRGLLSASRKMKIGLFSGFVVLSMFALLRFFQQDIGTLSGRNTSGKQSSVTLIQHHEGVTL